LRGRRQHALVRVRGCEHLLQQYAHACTG
jgi:hypothetical protein